MLLEAHGVLEFARNLVVFPMLGQGDDLCDYFCKKIELGDVEQIDAEAN